MRQYLQAGFDMPGKTIEATALHSTADSIRDDERRRKLFGEAIGKAGAAAQQGMKAAAAPEAPSLLQVAQKQVQAALEARRRAAVLQALGGIQPLV